MSRLILSMVLAMGVCLFSHAASAAPFSFFEPFDAPPLTPGTENSNPGDWEDGFLNGDNGWLVIEVPRTGNSFGQRDITGATPGDHFDQILNARTRNGAAAFAIRDLTATPLTSGTVTFDITNVLPTLGTPRFQLRLANSSGTLDGLILRFGELDAADNNQFDVNQVNAFETFVATVADSNTTTTTSAPLAWNSFFSVSSGNYVNLQVDFSTLSGTASVVITTTDHLGVSSSTAPVALNFFNALPLGVERVSLQMLAPGNAHVNGGLSYIDNYAIDSTAVDADPDLTGVTAEPDGSITIQWQSESNAAYQVRKNAAVEDPFDPIATVTADAPTAVYTDTNIVNNQGFYRVNSAP